MRQTPLRGLGGAGWFLGTTRRAPFSLKVCSFKVCSFGLLNLYISEDVR